MICVVGYGRLWNIQPFWVSKPKFSETVWTLPVKDVSGLLPDKILVA